MHRFLGLLFAVSLLPAASSQTAPAATPPVFVREVGGIREFRVEANGLRVLLVPDASAPVSTAMTTYHVGSRNEVTGTTGATHLLEHLFFKGTERFNRDRGTSLDQLLDRVGAVNNATTWFDRTNYYVNTPADQLPLVLDVLADHMRHLRLREEDRRPEMTVVRNEYEIGESNPFQVLDKNIWATAFIAHPYHHPTIGWRSDIELVPIEKLRAFHDTYYWPNNCTLTIAGSFDEAAVLRWITQFFAVLPASPHPIPQLYTVEPPQTGARRVVVKRHGELGVVGIAYKRPAGTSPDSAPLAVLGSVLGDGKNGRLYRALVDAGLATDVAFVNYDLRDPSLVTAYAFLAPGVEHAKAEETLLAALRTVAKDGITAEELARARQQITAQTAYSRDGAYAIAEGLNEAIAVGDWTQFVTFLDRIRAVSAEDVQRVARATFVDNQSTTGWFVPSDEDLPDENAFVKDAAPPAPAAKELAPVAPPTRETAAAGGDMPLADRAQRRTIHGVDVVALPTGVKDVVTIEGSLAAGAAFNPADNSMVAELVAAMLDKGTARRDKFALAAALENLGATVSFNAERFQLSFSARCLRRDVPTVIALLAEQLREPAFAADEVAKEKARLAGDVQHAFEQPNVNAAVAFSRAVYPAGHPNRLPGKEEQLADLAKVTREQLVAFHSACFGPASLRVVAVGDLDVAALQGAVDRAFAGWTGGRAYPEAARPAPAAATEVAVPLEDKPSISLLIGQATGLQARDADWLAVRLGTHALGGGSFSSRLIATVRDTEGLTYGIVAGTSSDTYSTGAWFIRGTFAASLLGRGENSTRRELTNWFERGVGAAELADQKANYLGVFKLSLATTSGMARTILETLQRGQTIADLDMLPARVNALTPEQVNAAVRRHLDPAKMLTVRAGTLPGPAAAP